MRAIAFVTASCLAGCSFAFVSGPPANHKQLAYFECSSSRTVPALDAVWTALQTINLIYAASRTDQQWNDAFGGNPPIARSTAVPLYATLALSAAAGMYYGYSRTGECRDAKAELFGRSGQGYPGMIGAPPATITAPGSVDPAPDPQQLPPLPPPSPTRND